jgi:hypothetical protein
VIKSFRFEEPGRIALSGVPETPEAVDWLHDQGVRAVVSLHPVSSEVEARLAERGIAWHPFLITDFAEGVPPGLGEALAFIREKAEAAPGVLIH